MNRILAAATIAIFAASTVTVPARAETVSAETTRNTTGSAAVSEAVQNYARSLEENLAPIYAQLEELRSNALAAEGPEGGTLLPPMPVESLETYQRDHVLAALPAEWRKELQTAADKARDQGRSDKEAGRDPAKPYSRYHSEFSGRPRGLAMPSAPEPREKAPPSVALSEVLDALEKAKAAAGGPDHGKALNLYQTRADFFGEHLAAKVEEQLRKALTPLAGALSGALAEKPPAGWKGLSEELDRPVQFYLASHYYEGRGSDEGSSGTGDGDARDAETAEETVILPATSAGSGDGAMPKDVEPAAEGEPPAGVEPYAGPEGGSGSGEAKPKEEE